MVDIASYKQKIEDKINSLTTSDSVASHMEILKAIRGVGGVVTVSSVNDLPAADDHEGSLYMVYGGGDTASFYTSNGTNWILITTDPSVKGYQLWGSVRNLSGSDYVSSPIQEASSSSDWKSISNGDRNSQNVYAIKVDNTLWVWGQNGNFITEGLGATSSPRQEVTGSEWLVVSGTGTSPHFGVGIKTDGTLWTWGQSTRGCHGTNQSTLTTSSPVQEISSSTNWANVVTSGFSAGISVIAVKTDGTLWGWGDNQSGRLGTNDTICYSSPVQEASSSTNWDTTIGSLASGIQHTLAKTNSTSGIIYGWGKNDNGQLGTNNTTSYSSPVQITGSGWTEPSAGSNFSAVIHASTRRLYVFGDNSSYGHLMQNNTTAYSSPVQEITGSSWSKISGGNGTLYGVKTDGTLWSCGRNTFGSLMNQGYVLNNHVSVPVHELTYSDNWIDVSGNEYGAFMLKDIE